MHPGAWIGLSARYPETAQSAGLIWVFPLTFASSAFIPTGSIPGPVRVVADYNPVTLAVDAVRGLTIGTPDPAGPAIGALLWLAVMLLIFVPLALHTFRRT